MDVHRSRFVRYPTSAISALAFTRSNDAGYTKAPPLLRLAIGRANGNVEIWNPQRGLWVQETIFVGNGVSIDGLAWTQDPDETDAEGNTTAGQYRLFSIASSSSLTEWDLGTGRLKRESTGNFSEIWCMSAQPRRHQSKEETQSQDLVAGCGDGALVLLSTEDDDLQFKRFLSRSSGNKARCICVTYQTQDRVVAGFVDNTIRIYDTRNGSMIRTMSLGVSAPGRPKNTLVWQVRCLPNGDIVSADSAGEVKFWDGKTYSLLQRIDAHESDCLDVAVSSDGRTVMSGGIDGRVAVHKMSTNAQGHKTWSKASHRRIHNGEVKAMATFDSKGMSVVVSGGADVAPNVTPLREFGKENIRSLPSLPQSPPVLSASMARLLVSWWYNDIYIWRIARLPADELLEESERPRKLVARITLDTESNVRDVSITQDGRLLAASTDKETKIFQLRKKHGSDSFAIRQLQLPEDLAEIGSRLMKFSSNGKWLSVVSQNNEVYIARITDDLGNPKRLQIVSKVAELDRRQRQAHSQSAFKDYDRTILHLAFATDGSVLVASDISGHLHSWILEGREDTKSAAFSSDRPVRKKPSNDVDSDSDSSDDDDDTVIFYGQQWKDNPSGHLLPKLESAPLVLTFRPSKQAAYESDSKEQHEKYRLWILTSKHQMLEFDVLGGRLSDWSRRNPSAALPQDFKQTLGRVMGAVWDVNRVRERIWLYGDSFVFMLNVGLDLSNGEVSETKKRRKPKEVAEEEETPKRRRLHSGAGGRIDEDRRSGAAGIVNQYEDGAERELDVEDQDEAAGVDDEDEDNVGLQLTRVKSQDERGAVAANSNGPRRFWCTFKYRSILGMVELKDGLDTSDERVPEVVIVERPHWDVQKENGA